MPIGSLSLGPLVKSLLGGMGAAEKSAEPAAKAETPEKAPPKPSAIDILADYDVRGITPGEFSALLGELHSAGHLGDADFDSLSRLRQEVEKAGHSPDEPIDLLEFARRRMAAQQALAEQSAQSSPEKLAEMQATLAELRQRVGWLEKLDALHRQDLDILGLDAVA